LGLLLVVGATAATWAALATVLGVGVGRGAEMEAVTVPTTPAALGEGAWLG